jgi:putative ATP-dependent endonuclease of OLD family
MRLLNFQCYKDSGDIPINKMTIFVGENDSGKSCILRALDFFMNNKMPSYNSFQEINGHREITSSIILTFKPNSEENIPPEYLIDNKITLKKEFSLDEADTVTANIFIQRFLFEIKELNIFNELKAAELKTLSKTLGLDYDTAENAKAKLTDFVRERFDSLKKVAGYSNIKWSEISPLLPVFEYYDSSDYGNPLLHVQTTLRNIYRTFFYNYDGNGNETLKQELALKKDEIEEVLNKIIQENLKEKVITKIDKVINIYGNYSIDFAQGFTLSDLLVDFGTGPYSINSIGEGSKKRLLLAIIEWDKEMKIKEPHKMVIRGYDEPDASLHYSAQKEIYFTLKNLSFNTSSHVQVIICTHSISMIDRAPARIINHIIQENGISYAEYLKDYNEQDIKEFLDSISEISGIKNSSLFFERCFLIVEGDTEENALPIIYRKLISKSLSEDGIVLINLDGNASWEPFLRLLNRNKSEATLLFLDKDIQNNKSRKITLDKLRQINFSSEFLKNNVMLVGNNEFEDVFSDELICRCLNTYWPKAEEDVWRSEEIRDLRNSGKFSDNLISKVNKYIYEHHDTTVRKANKPEFGKRIAEMASEEDIRAIAELNGLITRINDIIN